MLEGVERLGEQAGHWAMSAPLLEEVEVGRLGSRPFCTPSIPAISMAAKARYGLAVASGQRNSMRFAGAESEYIGIGSPPSGSAASRRGSRAPRSRTSRRYEFVVGAQNASSAGACMRMPPR